MHDVPKRDLFYLTQPDRFSLLPRPVIHVIGNTQTLEDRFAVARQHPRLPMVNEAAYGGEIVRFTVGEALRLLNQGLRTADEEEQLRELLKDLRAVTTKLRPLYRRLAPPDEGWSADARPAAMVDMWVDVLPQIKQMAAKDTGKKKPNASVVRHVLERREFQPWPNIPMYPGTVDAMLKVGKVLANDRALKTIVSYCLKQAALRTSAFRVVAVILEITENSVRHARDRYRKAHPEKRTGS